TTCSPSCGCAIAPRPWSSPSTTAWSSAPAELPPGGGAAQGPAQGGEDEHGQQPPGVHAGRVDQHRGQRERGDHDDRDAPVVADHEVVPERADGPEPAHELTTCSVAGLARLRPRRGHSRTV